METKQTYSTKEVATLAGVTYRQVDHWCSKGVLGEDFAKPLGSGHSRTFTEEDVLAIIACGFIFNFIVKVTGNRNSSLALYRRIASDSRDGKPYSYMTIGHVTVSVKLPRSIDASTT